MPRSDEWTIKCYIVVLQKFYSLVFVLNLMQKYNLDKNDSRAKRKMNQKGKEKIKAKNPPTQSSNRSCQTFRLCSCLLFIVNFLMVCGMCRGRSDCDVWKTKREIPRRKKKNPFMDFALFGLGFGQFTHLIYFWTVFRVFCCPFWSFMCCLLLATIKSRQKVIEKERKKKPFNFKFTP